MRRLRQRIRIRERLPIWGIRIQLGLVLLTLSELVMWQNPIAYSVLDWVVLFFLYVGLATILLDVIVRFQVRDIASLLLAAGLYGLVASTIINHSIFENLSAGPYALLIHGFGLQTAAGLYGLLLFILVMRGKAPTPVQAVVAGAIGVLWGVWVHWFPIQTHIGWGLVPIETATQYMILALFIVGFTFTFVTPRFRFFREQDMQMTWWEAILAGMPLFVALVVGMLQNIIPDLWLAILIAVGAFIVWVLYNQSGGTEPSIMAEITYPAPNSITYIVFSLVFFTCGSLAYYLVTDKDSVIGIAAYWLVFGFGLVGLPASALVIFWRVLHVPSTDASVGEVTTKEGE